MIIKYPRTPHLPSSPGATSDDRRMSIAAAEELFSEPVVVTEKMDGGNVTLSRDYFHARSLSDNTPRWELFAKSTWARIAHDIPQGWRVSAESLWAERSIKYDALPEYLMVIGIWDGLDLLPWNITTEWAQLLGLPTVPVLGSASSEREALELWSATHTPEDSEGFVVRSAGSSNYQRFHRHVAKWVRPNHVQTDAAWRNSAFFPTNTLAPISNTP